MSAKAMLEAIEKWEADMGNISFEEESAFQAAWNACEASHAAQRERADRLAEAVEKIAMEDLTVTSQAIIARDALAAYRNKEDAKA